MPTSANIARNQIVYAIRIGFKVMCVTVFILLPVTIETFAFRIFAATPSAESFMWFRPPQSNTFAYYLADTHLMAP